MRLRARRVSNLGAITLVEQTRKVEPGDATARLLAEGIARAGICKLWTKALDAMARPRHVPAPFRRRRMARPVRRRARRRHRLARAGARRQDRAVGTFARRPARRADRAAALAAAPPARSRSADPFRGADRHKRGDRLRGRGRPDHLDPPAGAVRPRHAPDHRGRARPAGDRAACRRRTGRCRSRATCRGSGAVPTRRCAATCAGAIRAIPGRTIRSPPPRPGAPSRAAPDRKRHGPAYRRTSPRRRRRAPPCGGRGRPRDPRRRRQRARSHGRHGGDDRGGLSAHEPHRRRRLLAGARAAPAACAP